MERFDSKRENRERSDAGLVDETLYDLLGGEDVLRQIINTFVDRVFDDPMIGFFFRSANRNRIKKMEFQLIANFLGAKVEYQGRPIAEVHAKHHIMGGQFARRLKILQNTLEDYKVPEKVRDAWLSHTEHLRPLITKDVGSACEHQTAMKRSSSLPENNGGLSNPSV